jgi:hypothetical protein
VLVTACNAYSRTFVEAHFTVLQLVALLLLLLLLLLMVLLLL